MSIIAHLCTRCGHPDYWRRTRPGKVVEACGQGFGCVCQCTSGEPVVLPTYDITGRQSEQLIPPNGELCKGVWACGCPACRALHEQLTAAPV